MVKVKVETMGWGTYSEAEVMDWDEEDLEAWETEFLESYIEL